MAATFNSRGLPECCGMVLVQASGETTYCPLCFSSFRTDDLLREVRERRKEQKNGHAARPSSAASEEKNVENHNPSHLERELRADVICEIARQELLRLGGFTCAHDTEIDPETLHHVGTCNGCPVIEAEAKHEMAVEMICRRERFLAQPTTF